MLQISINWRKKQTKVHQFYFSQSPCESLSVQLHTCKQIIWKLKVSAINLVFSFLLFSIEITQTLKIMKHIQWKIIKLTPNQKLRYTILFSVKWLRSLHS